MFGIAVDRGSVVLVEPPRDDSLSIRHEPSPLGPLPDRCQPPPVTSMAAVEEAAAQPDAHGLPREAGGLPGQTSWVPRGIPQLGPPSSTCGHRQARLIPSGTRLGTKRSWEVPNCNRIRSLEGSGPRIESPVLLRHVEDA
jgi:hypothetical protein